MATKWHPLARSLADGSPLGGSGRQSSSIEGLAVCPVAGRIATGHANGCVTLWSLTDLAPGQRRVETVEARLATLSADGWFTSAGFSGSPLVLADGSLAVGTQAGPVILGSRPERSRSIVAPWPVGRLGFARLGSLLVAEALDRNREGRRPRRMADGVRSSARSRG